MKLIAVGDNVTDCYLDEGIYYPGGNAVNVAVDCKRDGAEKVNYIGVFGNDDRADYIRACMEEEGVTCERSRKVFAPTCQPGRRNTRYLPAFVFNQTSKRGSGSDQGV